MSARKRVCPPAPSARHGQPGGWGIPRKQDSLPFLIFFLWCEIPYFFLNTYFTYLFKRRSDREGRDTEIFHLLAHSPSGCNRPVWVRTKPGARNSTLVSQVKGRGPGISAIFCCFPSCISKELDQKQRGLKTCTPTRDAGGQCTSLPGWATTPATSRSPVSMLFHLSVLLSPPAAS